jgi:hypothetical protein
MNRLLPAALLALVACAERAPPAAWTEEAGYRWRPLPVPRRGKAGFTVVEKGRSGIEFENRIRDSLVVGNRILAQGGGVAFADVDGDGLTDVYLCRTDGPNVLYRNLGEWRFEDVTAAAGVALADRFSTGAIFVDVDGDGDQDLQVNALGGPNALLLNDGTGRFTEDTTYPGRASRAGSTTTTAGDTDGDGWLELFTANYKAYTMQDSLPPQRIAFDQIVRQPAPNQFQVIQRFAKDYRLVLRPDLGAVNLVQRADPDDFLQNRGGGRLERVPLTTARFLDEDGRPLPFEPESFTLAARFVDIDLDRDPDLYVANDFEDPDEFWINDGRGNFQLIPRTALRTTSNSTMAMDFADVDRNGWPDLFQVDMLGHDPRQLKTQIPTHTALPKQPGRIDDRPQMQRNTFFLNRGDRTFAQVAEYAGVHASGWSWSTLFMDVDLDGWEDILVGTGHPWDLMDADAQQRLRNRLVGVDWRRTRWEYPPLQLPNVAFRNKGDLTFEDAAATWSFGPEADISHGMATADLDGDGDQDVIVNRLNAPALVLRNESSAPRIAVRLRGDGPNTAAIGSRIRVLGGAVPSQEREVAVGGLYLAHSDLLQTFGTGTADSVTIVVEWRDGRRTEIRGARPNRLYEISTATADPPAPAPAEAGPSLFEDRSADLGHRHVEADYDDYARQFLLPNKLSQLGPGVTWADLDRDGNEDLLIAAGRGGTLGIYRNDGGRLRPLGGGPAASDDQTGVLVLPDGRGGTMVLTGQANYEQDSAAAALAIPPVLELAPGPAGLRASARSAFAPDTASTGPIALADYDLDGDLDLFVGGRVLPGAYPLSPSSRLYRNDGGAFTPDPQGAALLRGVGMVSAALFADVDGDADQDLLLAIEWGTIRLFLNDGGRFAPAPESWGLTGRYSRWNGLTAGDLDGDGRLDLVATSWGRNTLFPADSIRPLLLAFGAIGGKGEIEMLFARHDPRIGAVAPLNTFARVSHAIPKVAERIRTFSRWADATLGDALGSDSARTATLGATTMDHLALMNRGGRFEAVPLPAEAQFAPAFHASVADFDGDGREDAFLSQNFFATEISVPRYDAGRSLLLLGDGRGNLAPMPGQRSGLLVYGEQRGAAHADFNGDGRLDLVVSQNAAATRLFVNRGATPGLRVRLQGPPGNPDGIGAQVRLVYGERMGPVREVHAGSGYWSQNGAVQVFGREGEVTGVWVRFAGRPATTTPVGPAAREIRVSY